MIGTLVLKELNTLSTSNVFLVDIELVFFILVEVNKPSLHAVPLKPSLQAHILGALQIPLIQGSSHIAKVKD